MTIASEITRLQNDKEAMRQSIINKGVDVAASVNFDDYASCIDAIEQGGGDDYFELDYLVVAGGGGGGMCGGGGGGGGQVIEKRCAKVKKSDFYPILIGVGGDYGKSGCDYGSGQTGTSSAFGYINAYGGGGGGGGCPQYRPGRVGMNGGGGSLVGREGGFNLPGGYKGGNGSAGNAGGGGASSAGPGTTSGCCSRPGAGQCGIQSNITGAYQTYGRGGAGGTTLCSSSPGNGSLGGGGAGGYSYRNAGKGGDGIVVVRYPSTCGYNLKGGCKYLCNGYCVHCFIGNGGLYSGEVQGQKVGYLAVGGGGGGASYGGGGGGGEVLLGDMKYEGPISITIGKGGENTNCKGGDTILGSIVARGGYGGSCGMSGNGNLRGINGGGGGAATNGFNPIMVYSANQYRSNEGGHGGLGIFGYGGGGGYYDCPTGLGFDGGGNGVYGYGCPATNCGGGGGGGCGRGGVGGCGVVDICYPIDGSFGFTTATGGDSCYVCNGICVHRFTSDGTFTIVG